MCQVHADCPENLMCYRGFSKDFKPLVEKKEQGVEEKEGFCDCYAEFSWEKDSPESDECSTLSISTYFLALVKVIKILLCLIIVFASLHTFSQTSFKIDNRSRLLLIALLTAFFDCLYFIIRLIFMLTPDLMKNPEKHFYSLHQSQLHQFFELVGIAVLVLTYSGALELGLLFRKVTWMITHANKDWNIRLERIVNILRVLFVLVLFAVGFIDTSLYGIINLGLSITAIIILISSAYALSRLIPSAKNGSLQTIQRALLDITKKLRKSVLMLLFVCVAHLTLVVIWSLVLGFGYANYKPPYLFGLTTFTIIGEIVDIPLIAVPWIVFYLQKDKWLINRGRSFTSQRENNQRDESWQFVAARTSEAEAENELELNDIQHAVTGDSEARSLND